MPNKIHSFLLLVSLSMCPLTGHAQTLTIDQVMSAEELRGTGVARLTPRQKAALNRWLTAYTLRIAKSAASKPAVAGDQLAGYGAMGNAHWVRRVGSAGRVVTLEDGSIWEVNVLDRLDTMLWLPTTSILVRKSQSPVGMYEYELINKDDGETALAKYLGK